jgi:hypothetical protein
MAARTTTTGKTNERPTQIRKMLPIGTAMTTCGETFLMIHRPDASHRLCRHCADVKRPNAPMIPKTIATTMT